MEKAASSTPGNQEVGTHTADYGARGAISEERLKELKLAQEGADERKLDVGGGVRGGEEGRGVCKSPAPCSLLGGHLGVEVGALLRWSCG